MISVDQLKLYTKCINFAAVKHKDQRRKDAEKTPYINHPIGMSKISSLKDLPQRFTSFQGLQTFWSRKEMLQTLTF